MYYLKVLLRKDFKWRKDQKEFIESLPGSDSEHIRRSIDDYIEKVRSRADATTSPSKKGGLYGRSSTNFFTSPTQG